MSGTLGFLVRRDDVEQQIALGRPAAIDRGQPDAGAVGYVLHAQTIEPDFGEQLDARRGDRLVALGITRPAARPHPGTRGASSSRERRDNGHVLILAGLFPENIASGKVDFRIRP